MNGGAKGHSRRRVVVTGLGVVAPAGRGTTAFGESLAAGRSCVHTIRRFDATGFPTRIAAEVPSDDESATPPEWHERGRIALFARDAARQALAEAQLPETARTRAGVVFASGLGTYGHAEIFGPAAASFRSGFDAAVFNRTLLEGLLPRAAARRTPGALASALAREFGLGGWVSSPMTACAAGTQAIGDAAAWIRDGRADVVLAGGSDSEIYPMGLASFCLLGALSTRNAEPGRASRPFDAGRDGFVLGEGAAALVLEERASALRRGARILAEVAGFGSACDAYRVTDPHPDGTGAVLSMRRALADGGVQPDAIGYVNAHGTSTVANDRIEARALRLVFGDALARIPVSSTKSMIGHLTVAAGAVEAVATILALASGFLPPTINVESLDAACDLDVVPNTARRARVDLALSNSFAFGGQTASLLIARTSS